MTDSAISPDALGSPSTIANPYPVYHALRPRSPVRYLRVPKGAISGRQEDLYAYAILKHADLVTALKDPATFSSDTPRVLGNLIPRLSLLHDDPPRHTHLRRLVNKAFTTQRVSALAGFIAETMDDLLGAIEGPNVDMVDACSVPLPMRVIAHMLGVPGEHYPSFKSWSEATIGYMGLPLEERQRRLAECSHYFASAIAARKAAPKDDLITALVQAEIDGECLSTEEIVRFAIVLLVAGNETTTTLIGNMLGILADRPALYEQARADRSLIEPIVEETLRFESPVQRFMRVTTREVTLGGVEIPANHIVDIAYGAANRDPAVFESPDTFDPTRSNKDHVAFAHGTHFCLGAPLARLEAKIVLSSILDRYQSIRRAEEPAERQTMAPVSFAYRKLPLILQA